MMRPAGPTPRALEAPPTDVLPPFANSAAASCEKWPKATSSMGWRMSRATSDPRLETRAKMPCCARGEMRTRTSRSPSVSAYFCIDCQQYCAPTARWEVGSNRSSVASGAAFDLGGDRGAAG